MSGAPRVKRFLIVLLLLTGTTGAQPRIDSTARVDASAQIGEDTRIDAGAVVEAGARIGRDVYVGPRARIGTDALIGDAVEIGAGTIIGPGVTVGTGVTLPAGLEISARAVITRRNGTAGTPDPADERPPPGPYGIKSAAGGAEYPHTFSLKLDLPADTDITEPTGVFDAVYAALPDSVTVMPTENYLYFRFETAASHVWGNLRLSPPERDAGVLHFAYFEFNADPQHREDFYSHYLRLDADDGVTVQRLGERRYRITFDERSVTLTLQDVPQTPPPDEQLRADEVWLQATSDESGLYFHLLFNTDSETFLWVLDEDYPVHGELQPLSEDVLLDERTGFAFYRDADPGRLILIGVDRQNIKQNNYYDGPFDQLADNYTGADSRLSEFMQRAYPYTKDRIDRYGHFTHDASSRVAVTPYYAYYETEELPDLVQWCRDNREGAEFYACIAYDHKTRY